MNLFSHLPECHVCRMPVAWKDGFIDADTGQICHSGKCRLKHYRKKQAKYMKTPIIYYGGKTRMLHHILPLIPDHFLYCEPFFGGGAVFFAKKPAKLETINDKLGYVVNFYKVLKTDYASLKTMVDATLYSREDFNTANSVFKNKDQHSNCELAWAFWFLSNFSYTNKISGGLRYSNDYNTIPAKILSKKKESFTKLLQERIENTLIENKDALEIIESRNNENCFMYIDPPYPMAHQGQYTGYTYNDLKELIVQLKSFKGKFLFSNYADDLLLDTARQNQWNYKTFDFHNNGVRHDNRKKTECLIWNYNNQEKLF